MLDFLSENWLIILIITSVIVLYFRTLHTYRRLEIFRAKVKSHLGPSMYDEETVQTCFYDDLSVPEATMACRREWQRKWDAAG